MVSEKKKQKVQKIMELIEEYPVVGILDLFKMPSKQLQFIKKNLRDNVLIMMSKKRLIKLALKNVQNKKGIEKLNEFEPKSPALILTKTDSFKVYKILGENKSPTYAKPNDTAPKNIIIPEGPTKLLVGPAIGDLQRVKIPAIVKEGRIHIRNDTIVVKKNEVISPQVANILKKLDIQPMETEINLLGTWEDGIIFGKDILAVNEEEYVQKLRIVHTYALNLSVNICYPNKESVKILIRKAYQNAKNLGVNAKILEKEIIKDLIVKVNIQTQTLKTRMGSI